jgi:hypothetical protein
MAWATMSYPLGILPWIQLAYERRTISCAIHGFTAPVNPPLDPH